ncbi:MAG: GTPase HflX [Alphaproteobacteria bacterium]|nr:GTPase HflX [Alphaproteobacteria bacterium]
MIEPPRGRSYGDWNQGSRRAIVVHPYLKRADEPRSLNARLEEATGLAHAIDLEVVATLAAPLAELRPATLIGKGKVDELRALCEAEKPELVICDGQLTPVQQRNLEKAWNTKVLDRTGLILEIFGERARTAEGRLQVELAHLSYQKGRLVRSWTHLERQRGGFGFLGGPGETQIEADRRAIGDRIAKLKRELEDVKRTRQLHREARRRVPFPVVAIVGYTNAGKSTLFNRLTSAEVLAKDQLFATLDPTMRGLVLPSKRRVILSDTVGFISDLPTQLVAAFRATLEEVLEADILLHVRDISHPDAQAQKDDVLSVLTELGVSDQAQSAMIEVWNKIDLIPPAERPTAANGKREPRSVSVSALTGEGFANLLAMIDTALAASAIEAELKLEPDAGADLAWAYEHGDVLKRTNDAKGRVKLRVAIVADALPKFERRFGARLVRH